MANTVGVAVVHRRSHQHRRSLAHHQITEISTISGRDDGQRRQCKDTTDANILSVVGRAPRRPDRWRFSRKMALACRHPSPDVPHGWTEVTDELVYLVVRMDPMKVLKVK
jgi:hypothetical protein